MAGYIAVGHGLKPSGLTDPGTIGPDGTTEHSQAHRVVEVIAAALARCGEPAYIERHAGPSAEDPAWEGSVAKANALEAAYAVEIHFDIWNAPKGGFGYFLADGTGGADLCRTINHAWGPIHGLQVRQNPSARALAFLKNTRMPATLWECGPVALYSDEDVVAMGEALAHGIINYVNEKLNPAIGWVDRPGTAPPPAPAPPDTSHLEAELALVTSRAENAEALLRQAKSRAAEIVAL
jgi:N-acetylmuramoyl-L-alanine amidase